MSLTAGQARFASTFARETGLNPHVVGAWLLAEQSGSAAQFYEAKGYNNWLNIARTDSGDRGGAHSSVWGNPDQAAKVSAEWIRGQGRIANEYGKPAPGVTAILQSAGQGPHRQIQAIARSGWASSGYHGGADLSALLGQTGNITSAAPQFSSKPPPQERTTQRFDQAGFAEAQQRAAGIRGIESLFPGNKPGDTVLREALERAGQEPTQQQYNKTVVVKTPAGTFAVKQGNPDPGASNNLHGILPEGAKVIRMDRKDQGRDVQLEPNQPLLAPGRFVFVGTKSDPTGFGPDYPIIKVLTGRFAGHELYYGHTDVAHGLRPGQVYPAGTHVATTSRAGHNAPPGWLELGYAPHGTPGPFGQPSPF